ncbi:putative spermidine/putrescine transport system ATP-binding protein [Rhizobium pisi]|uniref:ABC transporter ATP-binding protein n=1 Tax=Rhizobium pisi TaxID=574561 RepID=A0A427MX72_9HYPH|nr:ABC transporter ATP-binding protein [Rhizobium pisi]MBB3135885.1 putative spermidine/putrescine transport system ATP-binding protein [Rhizobium pisi]RSB75760.1 ABC transporter ATP-binding protein [Rhizobium pisi]TCA49396.1 ABC transporter ATP-binding protein [Rhizobium pisi]
MSGLAIREINKAYGPINALSNISLDVENGKFLCLLGPSGCGKSTLLRIIAGLEDASRGQILLDGRDITNEPAHMRNFGMVFQSLALFPHLSVSENIAFALRIRGASKHVQKMEVERLLSLVHLPGVADRSITQLSGGQRQRVAIARALALKPKLFLLDEPMSALDAKLREAMQVELKRLQQELGITTFLVTHDQKEAMTTADLVVLMSGGIIQQVAPPLEIYRNPANAFVADFIGAANLMEGRVVSPGRVGVPGGTVAINEAPTSGAFTFSVRPEDLELHDEASHSSFFGHIAFTRHLGSGIEVNVTVEGMEKDVVVALPSRHESGLTVGRPVHVHVNGATCVVLR